MQGLCSQHVSALSPKAAKVFATHTSTITPSLGPYFLSSAFLPLLVASTSKAPYGDKFEPQIINTVSMNGWTKV
jgi:NAD(P)-dependent dehydrogenase (short-subunit alcohol dehydrogenase family)